MIDDSCANSIQFKEFKNNTEYIKNVMTTKLCAFGQEQFPCNLDSGGIIIDSRFKKYYYRV